MNQQSEHAFGSGEIFEPEPPEEDELQEALREVYEHRQRLNATRDTVAVRASNANTRMLLDALRKSA